MSIYPIITLGDILLQLEKAALCARIDSIADELRAEADRLKQEREQRIGDSLDRVITIGRAS
jgi:hypothetical protein